MNQLSTSSELDGTIIHYVKQKRKEDKENRNFENFDKELFNIGHDIAWKKDLLVATETHDKIFALLSNNKEIIPKNQFFTVQADPHTIVALDEILADKTMYMPIIAEQIYEAFMHDYSEAQETSTVYRKR